MELLNQIAILFLLVIPVIYLTNKIKIPNIIGYIILGILIGPQGIKIITNSSTIDILAEIGITILMFFIGLELSLNKLKQLGRYVTILGNGQFLITSSLVIILLLLFGINIRQSIFISLIIVMSSTAIIMNHLISTKQLNSPIGDISFSISITQDLYILPILLFLPLLGSNVNNYDFQTLISKLLLSIILITSIFIAAKIIVPKLIHFIAKFRSSEIFTIGSFIIILITAIITHKLGFSLAVGALITGLILSDSDYNYQIVADLLPFKNILNIFFFVAIGLIFDIIFFASNIILILAITLSIILIKFIVVYMILKFYPFPNRIAIISGILLSQIGEFSFLLLQAGESHNILSNFQSNLILSSTVITMIFSPFLMTYFNNPHFYFKHINIDNKTSKYKDHVIIVGYGLTGQNLTRVLKETGIKYTIIELNPDTVQKFKDTEPIIFGDAIREEVLISAGVKEAKILVLTSSDITSSLHIQKLAHSINPSIYSIVRTKFVSEVEKFLQNGANVVIPEEYETSLQIFSKVLEKYHIPLNIIMKQISIFRNEGYLFLRDKDSKININSIVESILAQGTTETIYITEDNPNINKTLQELNLRALTNTTIIAIIRDGKTISNPGGKEILQAKDTLVITGTHLGIDKAMALLNSTE
ncbi:MAG TPA: cation:proton antiporter [Ignavibacteriales bacterium]|nr:cation:proton antiporter [Ignavibacteriales bacterium]HOL80459.1 cation:proton antiporter [Ignavibacteriales bacterium]HOM64910.1 cation:proton antiporter [Ignavibacteriales bacterium]HPP32648.1 cation:proton antiporter [Ignavibacteriales bacterium]